MSKAQRILELLAKGKAPKEIAQAVGCLTAYVRVVRQREQADDRMTPSGRAYAERNADRLRESNRLYKQRRYQTDPEYRERAKATNKRWREARIIQGRIREAADA
jgi:hypothetical protein